MGDHFTHPSSPTNMALDTILWPCAVRRRCLTPRGGGRAPPSTPEHKVPHVCGRQLGAVHVVDMRSAVRLARGFAVPDAMRLGVGRVQQRSTRSLCRRSLALPTLLPRSRAVVRFLVQLE